MNKLGYLFFFLLTMFIVGSNISKAEESIFDTSSFSLLDNDDEFLKVDDAFSFNFYQKDNLLQINFVIAEGYYLYRHQFKFASKNAELNAVILPEGEHHEDEFFGVQQIFTGDLNFDITINKTFDNASATIRYQGCAQQGLCYPPTTKVIELSPISESTTQQAVFAAINKDNSVQTPRADQKVTTKTLPKTSEQNQLADMLKQDSLVLTLLAFFVGGLLLSFTPCVFPMYPILTGIIVGQAKNNTLTTKKAFTLSFFYVQGMAVTYTILGIVVAIAGAQFQAVFQHPAVLISLSILFVFLACSMFGVFNLALPSSWQNKLNHLSNNQKGGSITGVLIMGIISGLVASPCTTAPLTGALLYISQTGDIFLGASALYALSLGMGLPLLILGSSGGKILPKAGAWMNIIKNVFGLLLLAVPIFLLERIISPFATEILWVCLLLGSASYFYVQNQNSSVNSTKGFWYGLRSLIIFLALFFGANSAYKLINPQQEVSHVKANLTQHFQKVGSLKELNQVIKEANSLGKTVMVDLYADWCIACKEFEKYTFNKPQVQKALSNTLLVQIDLTDTSSPTSIELMEHFKVFGLPSILFFDLNGEELSSNRITGFMNAQEFTEHVKLIL